MQPRPSSLATAGVLAAGLLSLSAHGLSVQFCSPDFIRGPSDGAATPYPSVINVNGVSGVVTDVDVTIKDYFADEVAGTRLLLVGPGGQSVMLMRWVGIGSGGPATFRFDDAAPGEMPFANFPASGTYQPTDFGLLADPPAPAPGPPYGTALSVFNGLNPNGDWSLYLANEELSPGESYASRIESGWCLDFTTEVHTVPEAGSPVLLLGLSLAGIGLAGRLRRS